MKYEFTEEDLMEGKPPEMQEQTPEMSSVISVSHSLISLLFT